MRTHKRKAISSIYILSPLWHNHCVHRSTYMPMKKKKKHTHTLLLRGNTLWSHGESEWKATACVWPRGLCCCSTLEWKRAVDGTVALQKNTAISYKHTHQHAHTHILHMDMRAHDHTYMWKTQHRTQTKIFQRSRSSSVWSKLMWVCYFYVCVCVFEQPASCVMSVLFHGDIGDVLHTVHAPWRCHWVIMHRWFSLFLSVCPDSRGCHTLRCMCTYGDTHLQATNEKHTLVVQDSVPVHYYEPCFSCLSAKSCCWLQTQCQHCVCCPSPSSSWAGTLYTQDWD